MNHPEKRSGASTAFVVGVAALVIMFLALVASLMGTSIALAQSKYDGPTIETVIIKETEIVERVETVLVPEVVTETIIDFIEVPPIEYYFYMNFYEQYQDHQLAHWEKCFNEYGAASTIWRYLTMECGLSNAVAAGILGNIMNECGGNSLRLNPTWLAGNYYGICMWSLKYNPAIKNKPLEYQLEYLKDSMITTFNASGALYKKGFTYQDFCELTDPCEAAVAFMKVYERPSSASLATRQRNALAAYAYFVRQME